MRILIALLLFLFAAPSFAQDATPEEERGWLLSFIEDTISAPNRQVRLQNIQGVLSSDAAIGLITVSDADGVWLRIENARIVWSRTALVFSQRLQIDTLAADLIEVVRQPLPDESAPAPEATSFQIPELPVAVNLDALEVPRVVFGPNVFGLASELAITGRIRLEDGNLDTALDITRLDGPGGQFDLAATYTRESEQLDVSLNLSEPENGLVANLLNIEGRPPVALSLTGSGPLSGLDLALTLDADGERTLTGEMALRRQADGLAWDTNLGGPIARLIPAQFRDFFGSETRLSANGVSLDAGGMRLDALNLDSGALDLTATAETSADSFLRRLNLKATLDDGTNGSVILPVPGGETTVNRADFTLSFGESANEEWTGLLTVKDLATAEFAAANTEITMGGAAQNLDRPEDRRVTFTVGGGLSGIVAKRADVGQALGDRIDLDVNGSWNAGEAVKLAQALLSGNGLAISLVGEFAEMAFNGDIAVKADSIAPFSAIAGRDLAGSLDLRANGTVEPLTGAFDLTIDSASNELSVGIDAADNLLAGRTTITGKVGRGEQGLAVSDLRVGNDRVEITADGRIATGTADFNYGLDLSDLALLTPQAAGRLEAGGRIAGADGNLTLTTVAQVASGSLAGKRLTDAKINFDGTLENGALDGTLGGDAFLDGVRTQLAAGVSVADGVRRLTDLDFTAGGARATGAVTQNADGLLEGTIDVQAADISTAAALFLTQASGALNAAIELSHADGLQNAEVKADASDLRIAENRIGAAEIAAQARDLFNVPAIDGTVKAERISAGGVDITSINANASTSNNVTQFAADTVLANGARGNARGSLAAQDDGWRLALDEASFGQGQIAARLARPAAIRVAGDRVAIDTFEIDVAGGRVTVQGDASEALDLNVVVSRLPLSIANLVRADLGLGGTLEGEARVRGSRSEPQATFSMRGSALQASGLEAAGISTMDAALSGSFANQTVTLTSASANSPQGLTLTASGAIPLSGNGLSVNLNGSAPLSLANRFLADRGTQITGIVEVNGSVSGSLQSPSIRGMFSTSGAQLVDPDSNLRLSAINIMGAMDGETVTIRTANAALASGGSVSASGNVSINADAGFPADIRIQLNQARYADGDMVVATVSGNLAVGGALARDPQISGELNVERAEIAVPDNFGGSAASLDVIHKNAPAGVRETLVRARANDGTPVPSSRPSVLRLNVGINAPARIFVRGRGLDAELGGRVQLTGPVTDIQPVGGFTLIRGRLGILGQRITFDEGTVTLVGDLDPYLDFVARSDSGDTIVYINVRGRVSALDISFSSQPELPEDEVLARLIFNRSISELSPLQIAQLAAAAAELAGGGNTNLLGSLRDAVGLDDLDVVTDSQGNAAVRAGRYIQENIYLGVEAGAGGTTRGSINLDITEDLKARGAIGSDGDTSLGVFYERDY